MTDAVNSVTYDAKGRPGVSNLVDMMYYFDESVAGSPEELADDLHSLSMKALKEKVADTVDGGTRDIRGRYEELMGGDQKDLVAHAEDGARRAEDIAEGTMERVRDAMGMRW